MIDKIVRRADLFAAIEYPQPKFSPDGAILSWVSRTPDSMELNFSSVELLESPLGPDHKWAGSFDSYIWCENNTHVILYYNDPYSTAQYICSLNISSKEEKRFFDESIVTVDVIALSSKRPNDIVVRAFNVDRDVFYYIIDVKTGILSLIPVESQEYQFIGFDLELNPRFGIKVDQEEIYHFYNLQLKLESPVFSADGYDFKGDAAFIFSSDGSKILMKSTSNNDVAALVLKNLIDGHEDVVAVHDKYDVDITHCLVDRQSLDLRAATASGLRREWFSIRGDLEDDFKFLVKAFGDADFVIIGESDTATTKLWLIEAQGPKQPNCVFIYDRKCKTVKPLFQSYLNLNLKALCDMRPVTISARDGRTLVCYLTLPNTDVSTTGPGPLVLMPHGGPWSRDRYGFDPYHQWLASRGYAVLAVNYRLSIGFGRDFFRAGELQHSRSIHDDLVDGVRWAVDNGIADPERVAIYGTSYGGYAALVGATFTPDLFACSVAENGFGDVSSLLEDFAANVSVMADAYRTYGDPRTEAGQSLLRSCSPINMVSKETKPILIIHGALDARCSVNAMKRFADKLKLEGTDFLFLQFLDEGHNIAWEKNRLMKLAVIERFLSHYIGGRVEVEALQLQMITAYGGGESGLLKRIFPEAVEASHNADKR